MVASESEPLLDRQGTTADVTTGEGRYHDEDDWNDGETLSEAPESRRRIGVVSAIFLIFNRIIGTGIFSTPSIILRSAGSVGVTMLMWVIGAAIAATGTAVYVELGTGLPRSGGEKTYMEYIYRNPKLLVSCIYASYGLFVGWLSANSTAFGQYVLHAFGVVPGTWNVRLVGIACITFCLIMHGVFMKWGVRMQDAVGFFKVFILLAIIVSGIFHLFGVPGFELEDGVEVPHNLEWDSMWQGTTQDVNSLVTGMFNVAWAYIGYHNANYVLSEVKNPIRTIKIAAPVAVFFVTMVYLLVNIAYFAVVSRDDILGSRQIVAALFFRNLFGPKVEQARHHIHSSELLSDVDASQTLSIIIALSTLGNISVTLFAYGRVVQELGREAIIPFSPFFASNKPFGTPLAGLMTQALVSSAIMIASPPGDAYLLMLSLSAYPLAIFNTLVSGGLLLLYTPAYKSYHWRAPFRAYKPVVSFFFLSNLFLVTAPFIPPAPGFEQYEHLPYWSHAVVALSISLIGICYWFVRFNLLPRRGGYKLRRQWLKAEDGIKRSVFVKIPDKIPNEVLVED
ncbi:amino acid transporter [Neolentinus lepideus HHB14362 ss-1]|uniref:Amino acid transporter n=1 Tax=Neolentinus lepideus HHB14362 ss-1 TaxID=1314782 RepID=A0A165UHQ9_9AGAM|nr:amino acid transporter [Neolentinus lepideus HHB14362 ss-1]